METSPKIETADILHPDTQQLLKDFMEALATKLIRNQQKYGLSNDWLNNEWKEHCQQGLLSHLEKGDPKDVAIYSMFLWYHGWPTVPSKQKLDEGGRKILEQNS